MTVTEEASKVLQSLRAVATVEPTSDPRRALLDWAETYSGTLVIPIVSFGAWAATGQEWNEAVDALSWLTQTWPEARLVCLIRDTKETAKSMERTWPLWTGTYGKGLLACVHNMEKHRGYLLDYHDMNPTRTTVLRFEDLLVRQASMTQLAAIGLHLTTDAWDKVSEAGKPAEDYPPPEKGLREERQARYLVKSLARMQAFEARRLGIPVEQVAMRQATIVVPEKVEKPTLFDEHVPRPPRPVIELFPGPVDGMPTVSISIMAHPSRLDLVNLLRKELGSAIPVSVDDGHGLVENCAKSWELHDPAADYHLVLQDDTILCDDFVTEVRRVLGGLQEPSAVSLYFNSNSVNARSARDALSRGEEFFWDCVVPGPAICLPTAWIPEMLTFFRAHTHRQDDTRIGYWLASKDRKAYFPFPCLVDHRGERSVAGNHHRGSQPALSFAKTRRSIPHGMVDGPRAIFYQYLGAAARWDELKYSLRSVHRYFRDKECPIYVIGDKAPEWFVPGERVRFITIDEYRTSRYEGLWKARKLGLQCAEEILQMDDDMYFLRDVDWEDFEVAFADIRLSGREAAYLASNRHWLRGMAEASLDLRKTGIELPYERFSTHTPNVWNRAKMLRILRKFFIHHRGSLENLYHNYYKTPFRSPDSWRVDMLPADEGARMLNHKASGPDTETRDLLRKMFPEQAPWEGRVSKIIHQTWKSHSIPRDVYPERWQESWKNHHPEWEYKFWTDADLLLFAAENYPEFTYLLREARGVIKADVGRLLVLYHFGGLYADMDYLCLRPMDSLVQGNSAFVSTLGNNYTHNALMACSPGHPLMIETAREALRRWNRDPHGNPEWVSGPDLLTQSVKNFRPTHWSQHDVCPIDWRIGHASGLGDIHEGRDYRGAHAVTFWRHNW